MKTKKIVMTITLLAGLFLFVACATGGSRRGDGSPTGGGGKKFAGKFEGQCAWYGEEHNGRMTASGEIFDMNDLTAAHRDLPFGTKLKITNLSNGRETTVRVNDRGPWVDGRVLDVSYAAAQKLGFVGAGLARIRAEVIQGEREERAGGVLPAGAGISGSEVTAGDGSEKPLPERVLVIKECGSEGQAQKLFQKMEERFPKIKVEKKGETWLVILHNFNSEDSRRKICQKLIAEGYPARLE